MSAASGPAGPGAAEGFAWDEAMAAGLGLLGLSPRDFWAMTPREFARAIGPFTARTGEPMARGALDGLMRRYPDRAAGPGRVPVRP